MAFRNGSRSSRPLRRFRPWRVISWARSDPSISIVASLTAEMRSRPPRVLAIGYDVARVDAGDGPERRRRLRDLVDSFHVVPRRMSARGEVRRDRLRLAELLRLPVHELDHPELRLAVEDWAAVPFVGLRAGHDHVGDRRAGELVRDVALFV